MAKIEQWMRDAAQAILGLLKHGLAWEAELAAIIASHAPSESAAQPTTERQLEILKNKVNQALEALDDARIGEAGLILSEIGSPKPRFEFTPPRYDAVYEEGIRTLDSMAGGEVGEQPIAVKLAAIHQTLEDQIAACDQQTSHAKVPGTKFCRCTHVMYD